MSRTAIYLLFLLALPLGSWGQGALEPPVPEDPLNPIVPSMRTLTQVEPRTPIEELPITISAPGSYFLTRSWDLDDADVDHAIIITASDVSVDLGGFTLHSLNAEVISIEGAVNNIRISNGVLRNSGGGVGGATASHVTVEKVTVREVGPLGITLGNHAKITHSTVHNSGAGISVGTYGYISNCAVYGVAGGGFVAGLRGVVRDCSAQETGLIGFSLQACQAEDLVAFKNDEVGVELIGGSLKGAVCSENDIGVLATDATVTQVMAANNAVAGFSMSRGSVTSSVAYSNQTGFQLDLTLAVECQATFNSTNGFFATGGATLRSCRADVNGSNGIQVTHGTLEGCAAQGNSLNGIQATAATLRDCRATSNSRSGFLLNGCAASQLQALHNSEVGIECGVRTQLTGSQVENNQFSGITALTDCVIRDNICLNNGSHTNGNAYAGIFLQGSRNRVEGNHCTWLGANNDFGIQVQGETLDDDAVTGNMIIGNSASGNGGGNFDVPPGNYLGTVLTTASSGSSSAAHANFDLD